MKKFNKEFLQTKDTIVDDRSFNETKENFLKDCEEAGIRKNVLNGMFMRVNKIEEIYYFILMNDPMWLGTEALQAIYDCNLYKRYGFCDEEINVIKWIDRLSREEYFFIASQILEKQRDLINVKVDFKGFGYYTLVKIPTKNGYKICAKDIEDIKKLYEPEKL